VFVLATASLAHRFLYPKLSFPDLAKIPGIIVTAQLLAYLVVLGFMYVLVMRETSQNFWRAIRWNFPANWRMYLFGGVLLSIGLQLFAHLLPIPKNLPMDQFFQTTSEAYLLSIFGVTFAPLLEELFFRGFLYPVLARRGGVAVGVVLTAIAFALLHGAQLGFSWGPVLVIFIVGLVLTLVRAVKKSVAAGLLIHIAYNGTLSLMMFMATGGFRHLERLNQ
jgi:membrane protease YdiL (CAAX protease family)